MEEQIEKFRFKGYEFRYYPARFQIQDSRNLKVFLNPFGTPMIQDLGFFPQIITGQGTLTGEQMLKEFNTLQKLFLESSSGLLYLPNEKPIDCYFSELSIVGEAGPRMLHYQFTFTEDCEKSRMGAY